jgi:hypothetical protein
LTYAELDRGVEAVRVGEVALEMMPASRDYNEHRRHLMLLAQIYIRTGNREAALETLESLQGKPIIIELTANFLRLDPLWAPIRDHPRFKELVANSP